MSLPLVQDGPGRGPMASRFRLGMGGGIAGMVTLVVAHLLHAAAVAAPLAGGAIQWLCRIP